MFTEGCDGDLTLAQEEIEMRKSHLDFSSTLIVASENHN